MSIGLAEGAASEEEARVLRPPERSGAVEGTPLGNNPGRARDDGFKESPRVLLHHSPPLAGLPLPCGH